MKKILMMLLILTVPVAQGYEFLNNGAAGKREVPIELYVNAENCEEILTSLFEWIKVYDYLIPTVDITWEGYTQQDLGYDDRWVIACATLDDWLTEHEQGLFAMGFARTYSYLGIPVQVDVLFNEIWGHNKCVVPHELGHLVGLAHSTDESAAMYSSCRSDYLTPDDLVGIADLYGIDANCSGYANEDGVLFFPHYKGDSILMQNVGGADFELVEVKESVEWEWSCHQDIDDGVMYTDVIYKGEVWPVSITHDGVVFTLEGQ